MAGYYGKDYVSSDDENKQYDSATTPVDNTLYDYTQNQAADANNPFSSTDDSSTDYSSTPAQEQAAPEPTPTPAPQNETERTEAAAAQNSNTHAAADANSGMREVTPDEMNNIYQQTGLNSDEWSRLTSGKYDIQKLLADTKPETQKYRDAINMYMGYAQSVQQAAPAQAPAQETAPQNQILPSAGGTKYQADNIYDPSKTYGRQPDGSYVYSNSAAQLQRDLNRVMNAGLTVDGYFGEKTQQALDNYLTEYGKADNTNAETSATTGKNITAPASADSATSADEARREQSNLREALSSKEEVAPEQPNPIAERAKELNDMAANDPEGYWALVLGLSEPAAPAAPPAAEERSSLPWAYSGSDVTAPDNTPVAGDEDARLQDLIEEANRRAEQGYVMETPSAPTGSGAYIENRPEVHDDRPWQSYIRTMPLGYSTPATESLAGNSYSEALQRAGETPQDTNIFRQDLEAMQEEPSQQETTPGTRGLGGRPAAIERPTPTVDDIAMQQQLDELEREWNSNTGTEATFSPETIAPDDVQSTGTRGMGGRPARIERGETPEPEEPETNWTNAWTQTPEYQELLRERRLEDIERRGNRDDRYYRQLLESLQTQPEEAPTEPAPVNTTDYTRRPEGYSQVGDSMSRALADNQARPTTNIFAQDAPPVVSPEREEQYKTLFNNEISALRQMYPDASFNQLYDYLRLFYAQNGDTDTEYYRWFNSFL